MLPCHLISSSQLYSISTDNSVIFAIVSTPSTTDATLDLFAEVIDDALSNLNFILVLFGYEFILRYSSYILNLICDLLHTSINSQALSQSTCYFQSIFIFIEHRILFAFVPLF